MPEGGDGAVEVLRCRACGALDPGPRELCGRCHARAFEAHRVAGRGTLVSWTRIRHPPERFADEGSYAVAVVALEAGVRVTGRLAEPDEGLAPGAPVRCCGRHAQVPLFEACPEPEGGRAS